ncbi:ABC transporter ATP-binding protein [Dactylosporangium sp. CA-233914]|uniref:ABC transporter ATP-binding protein n=1 Tax=Dactylosporangium sp. CA-233914 TaxID=3239934 RepID=UPI003D8A7418
MADSTGTVALAACGITKRYGEVTANDAVSLDVRVGEVHALLGENGAGKTTLMRMAYGMEQPDEGHFEVGGHRVELSSPRAAINAGIGMVHQHFMLVPTLSVAENIVLGAEPHGALGRLDRRRIEDTVAEFAQRQGLPVDPRRVVSGLAVGEQQRVEILRTLFRGARVIVLDEPTAVLTTAETESLFDVLRSLRTRGHSVVLITHKMREVMSVADRISVLRRGALVGTVDRSEATVDGLVTMMVGRAVDLEKIKKPAAAGEARLQVRDLVVSGAHGDRAVDCVNLEVGTGEIVGIAGVDGNGQGELVAAIAGMSSCVSGTIRVDGQALIGGVRGALRAGVRYIAEDRHRRALLLPFSVAENLALRRYRSRPLSWRGWLSPRKVNIFAKGQLGQFDVRGPSPQTPVSALSGGNQQKVVIARELESSPAVLIAAQPTRGLDIGAIEFVHGQLLEQQRAGTAILLVSFELDELRALSDRILVMYEGRIVAEFPPDVADELIGLAMAGMTGAA